MSLSSKRAKGLKKDSSVIRNREKESNQTDKALQNISPLSSKYSGSAKSSRSNQITKGLTKANNKPMAEQSQPYFNQTEQRSMVLSDKEEEEVMEYFEVDDVVFAKSGNGYFEPAVVVKPSKDYSEYKVRFIRDKQQKGPFLFEELKDYNDEHKQAYLKLAETLAKDQASQLHFAIAKAEKKICLIKLKQKQRVEEELADSYLPKERKNLNKTVAVINEEVKVAQKRDAIRQQKRRQRGVKRSEKVEKPNQSVIIAQIQPQKEKVSERMVETKTKPNIIIKTGNIGNDVDDIEDIRISKPRQPMISETQTLPVSERKKTSMMIENPPIQKESALLFLRQYEQVSEAVTLTLAKLSTLKKSLLANLAQNIIEKFDKILQQESEFYPSVIVDERYGNYTDIIAYLFKKGLLSVEDLTSSRVIIKSVLFVWHYEEFEAKMKNKGYLCYEYELLRTMVKYWHETYESQSAAANLDKQAQINRENILNKLQHWSLKCRTK